MDKRLIITKKARAALQRAAHDYFPFRIGGQPVTVEDLAEACCAPEIRDALLEHFCRERGDA